MMRAVHTLPALVLAAVLTVPVTAEPAAAASSGLLCNGPRVQRIHSQARAVRISSGAYRQTFALQHRYDGLVGWLLGDAWRHVRYIKVTC